MQFAIVVAKFFPFLNSLVRDVLVFEHEDSTLRGKQSQLIEPLGGQLAELDTFDD
jgi:hypothetical protein